MATGVGLSKRIDASSMVLHLALWRCCPRMFSWGGFKNRGRGKGGGGLDPKV